MTSAVEWLRTTTPGLLVLCGLAIAILLFTIIKVKLEPFIALLLTGLGLALAAGLPVKDIVGTAIKSGDSLLETGFGSILGHIAVIIGLGTVLGRDPRTIRRGRRAGAQATRHVRRTRRPRRDGPARPDLRHPRLLRHRHLRAGAADLCDGQARRQVAGAVRDADGRRPVDDARVPASAPRACRAWRAARDQPRVADSDGIRLRHPGFHRRGHRVGHVHRQARDRGGSARVPRRTGQRSRRRRAAVSGGRLGNHGEGDASEDRAERSRPPSHRSA